MPLRQSTLSFGLHNSASFTSLSRTSSETMVHKPIGSPVDADTIVVDITHNNDQLPTPSDSISEFFSENSQTGTSKKSVKSRSKRVPSVRARKSAFQEDLTPSSDGEQEAHRNISGRTLVEGSPDRLPKTLREYDERNFKVHDPSGILNEILLDDAIREMEGKEAREESKAQKETTLDDETSSVITVRDDSEDDKLREEKREAKRIKMEENAKKWEQRKHAADASATRRSGRASLLNKASELLDSIKDTVLGKRSRDASEIDTSTSKVKPASNKPTTIAVSNSAEEPAKKKVKSHHDKKWMTSGLYAGQPRMFDARLNENKNKHKSKECEEKQAQDNKVMPLPMFAGERLLKYGRDFKLPFDIFSPLPAGQPKPDEWKKVNKNVFVGDAAAEWRNNNYVEHSTCACKMTVRNCGQDCMNRYMYYECDERNCVHGLDDCGNRPFEELRKRTKVGNKYSIGVEVLRTEDRGYGVRPNRSFKPNQIIVEYTGEIITQEECERRMRTIYKDNECYYLMLFDQNMIIDATRGSIARFVNHSCEPNCRMEKWTVAGKPRMALFAGDRGVMTGEELTYDYNFDPYSQKNVQQCRCGAKTCRGILGPKPKPEPKRSSPENEGGKKKKVGKLTGTKRAVAAVLEESTNYANKKRKVTPVSAKKANVLTKAKKAPSSPKKKILVKSSAIRKVSVPKSTTKIGRSDSTLRKVIAGAKSKAGSLKSRRVMSSSSATEALLGKKKSPTIARSSSLKEKAKSMTKSIRSRTRTIVVAG